MRHFAAGMAVSVLAVFATASRAGAQLCYEGCFSCGTSRSEGDGQLGGHNEASCCSGNGCCQCAQQMSSRQPVAAEVVARSLVASRGERLQRLVETFRNRVVVHRERDLLLVLGSPCDSRAVASVVFLKPGQMKFIDRPSLESFASYAASRAGTAGPAAGLGRRKVLASSTSG